jgi:signal transduction histidine kinase
MQQVFGNILLNSIDASPAGGTVEVEAGPADEPGSVVVSFRDHGEGIEQDLIERLFEPYVTSKPNGVGLGLSVSKKIVEAHGGRIEVTSRPAEGATFTVVLPCRAGEEPAMVAA